MVGQLHHLPFGTAEPQLADDDEHAQWRGVRVADELTHVPKFSGVATMTRVHPCQTPRTLPDNTRVVTGTRVS